MIIEFTGASGAGKTRIREEVARELVQRGVSSQYPLTALWGDGFAAFQEWPRVSNILLDAAIAQYCLAKIRGCLPISHTHFSRFCNQAILIHAKGLKDRLRLLRSTARKLAMDHYFRKHDFRQHCILIDEGLVHLAPMIFGRGCKSEYQHECQTYGKLTPRPDLLVWVTAPLALLEKRIADRDTHLPLPDSSAANRRRYLSISDNMIAAVVEEAQPNFLKIENNYNDLDSLTNHARSIADKIDELRRSA